MPASDEPTIADAARTLDLAPGIAGEAARRIGAGEVHMLALAGRLASGKDTIGRLAVEGAARAGGSSRSVCRISFGEAIIVEGDEVIRVVARTSGLAEAARGAAELLHLPAELLRPVVEVLAGPVRSRAVSSARERLPVVRRALQLLGDARRATEPDYWLRIGLAAAIRAAADGASVYIPDVRTVAEAVGTREIGCLLVRVECTDETRRRRLAARDGVGPDERAATHATETALDSHEGVDLRVRNDVDVDFHTEEVPAVQAIVTALLARSASARRGACRARY